MSRAARRPKAALTAENVRKLGGPSQAEREEVLLDQMNTLSELLGKVDRALKEDSAPPSHRRAANGAPASVPVEPAAPRAARTVEQPLPAAGGSGSDAALASQISGGGCLPPPTPKPPGGDLHSTIQAATMRGAAGERLTAFAKYSADLPASLAFRSSTNKAFVEGLGGFIDSDNMRVPEDPSTMGVTLRHGAVRRVDRPRRCGAWQTSSSEAAKTAWAPGAAQELNG